MTSLINPTRRRLLAGSLAFGGGALLSAAGLFPRWALAADQGNFGLPRGTQNRFSLNIGRTAVRIGGRAGSAVSVNGTLPAPLIRLRQDEPIVLDVTNTLDEDSSIHWHGVLVPPEMDGVPGVSYPGIRPGETFRYAWAAPQNGTYWYHSHSGFQEQLGLYGPLIIDPAGEDPVAYDREYVLVLSDWSFENPDRIYSNLKADSGYYNYQRRTIADFADDVGRQGLGKTLAERMAWGAMRMTPTDISDVGGATYTFLINGHSTADNWNGVFKPGERVRLRIINASAMTLFNIRIPGLPMTVVANDGQNVQPVETDEFQMGVAETYDVIITPSEARPYAFVAEAIDRSGQAVATFGPQPGMRAEAPAVRKPPRLTMRDMGMGAMAGMDHSAADMPRSGAMPMDHGKMDMDMGSADGSVRRGPGVDMVAMAPASRLDEPGTGLEDVGHRALRYSQLRSLTPNADTRPPGREIFLHLTANMERYMWSFDGAKLSEGAAPITLHKGERVRLTMINDTMMNHPIHLHGMFFDLVNSDGGHLPQKHTVIVKPADKVSVDISAENVGDWAFHCHLMFHMHAGMMRIVQVLPDGGGHMDHMDHAGHGEAGQ